MKAAADFKVSPRLVTYATKVLHHGCPELIAAVESGGLKISVAVVFADLPRERQIEEVSRGPQRAAGRARKLVAQAEAERIGSFGRLPQARRRAEGEAPVGHRRVVVPRHPGPQAARVPLRAVAATFGLAVGLSLS